MLVSEDRYSEVRLVMDVYSRFSLTTRHSRSSKSSMPDNTSSNTILMQSDGPPDRADSILNDDVHGFREAHCERSLRIHRETSTGRRSWRSKVRHTSPPFELRHYPSHSLQEGKRALPRMVGPEGIRSDTGELLEIASQKWRVLIGSVESSKPDETWERACIPSSLSVSV